MHRLTARRFALARPVLDKCREQLFARWTFDAESLEAELVNLWRVDQVNLRQIICDLAQDDRYREVAAHVMENSHDAGGVVLEFQEPLARLYAAESWYAADVDEKRRAFWDRAFQSASG